MLGESLGQQGGEGLGGCGELNGLAGLHQPTTTTRTVDHLGVVEPQAPMVVGFFAYWCIGLTSAWWFGFHLGGKEVGLWWGLVLGLAVASVLLTGRYRYHFLHPDRLERLAHRTDMPATTRVDAE